MLHANSTLNRPPNRGDSDLRAMVLGWKKMGFIEFLNNLPFLKPLSFERYPDSFATSRTVLYQRLMGVVRSQVLEGSAVFLTAHFPDEFFRLQTELHQHQVDYRLITRPLDHQWFIDQKDRSQGAVYLVLAEFLSQTQFSGQEVFNAKLDLILVDRHPEPDEDRAVEAFARAFPATTKMGYFLALEDRVLDSIINETVLLVLNQMGIDDHGLISSGIISKRVTKVLDRQSKRRTGIRKPADSIDQWYQLNDQNDQ